MRWMGPAPRSRGPPAVRPSRGRRLRPCTGPPPQTAARTRATRRLPAVWRRTTQPRSQRQRPWRLRRRRCQPSNLRRRPPPPSFPTLQPARCRCRHRCGWCSRPARPTSLRRMRRLARAIPAPAADSVSVLAYAAGKPDDPSTARRLSLSRGLAVRSVLLASGIPSAQIYVRALGSTPSNGPADRVELTVAPIGTVAR